MSGISSPEGLLSEITSVLSNGSSLDASVFQKNLQELGHLLQMTNQDASLLKKLTRSQQIWQQIKDLIGKCVLISDDPMVILRVRLVRGIVILSRNLISDADGVQHCKDLDIRGEVFQLMSRVHELALDDAVVLNLDVSCFQFFYNFSTVDDSQKVFEKDMLVKVTEFAQYNQFWNEELSLPFCKYLENLFQSSDFLYDALSLGEGKPIFQYLLAQYERIDLKNPDHELSLFELLIVKIFSTLIIHESFLKFITVHNDEDLMIRYYKVAEAIITSKSNWEVFELTVILSWNYELFQKTVTEVQQYFKVHEDDKDPVFIYEKTSRVLDILSTLVHFEHSRKFLLSYNGVEKLVELLGVLHQNIKAKRLKDSEKMKENQDANKIEYKAFPHTKSMIIEILNALVHENFEVQEKMREVHGLELVLSNCIIDDNEPFIKERSIVCLRFLLLNNQKNQEFVSKLEAREAIPNETLDEAGFEVDIVDGKVKLKEKQKIKEVN
jgi:ataxin-10